MPEEDIAYMRQHPPRCIQGRWITSPPEVRSAIEETYGQNTTAFAIRCDCGGETFNIAVPDEPTPVFLKCAGCALEFSVFDPTQHGYEGELGNLSYGYEDETGTILYEEGSSHPHRCDKCQKEWFKVACGFQYSGETDVLRDESLEIQPEDLFGGFILAVRCESCGGIALAYEWECA
jgi:hypothetical protein